MIIARKIAYNVVFNATAKVISTAIALVSIGFITRYLGKEGFGNYATVLAFFSFFGAIADLGLYSIATREISRDGADEKRIIGNVFTLRIISSLAVFLLSPLIFFLPYPMELKLGIIIAATSFVFSSSYLVLNGIFQKRLAMDRVAIVELFGKIIQLSVIVFVVKNDLGFTLINLSLLAYMLFNFSLILFLSRKFIPFRLSFDFPFWRRFLKESLSMGASVIVTFLYFKMDTILLSLMKTGADVGIYNAAYKVIENIAFFPAMIIGLIFPMMSRYIFSDREKFDDIANKTFKVFVLLIVPLVVGGLFLADDIIAIIGGIGFAESGNVLRILIVALAFIFLGNFFTNILIAGNLQKKMMYLLAVCAALNVATNIIVIPVFSYYGTAVTSAATEMLVVVATAYLAAKKLGFIPKLDHGWRILISGGVMALALFALGKYGITPQGSIVGSKAVFAARFLAAASGGVVAYAASLWITRTVRSEELLSIFSRNGKASL